MTTYTHILNLAKEAEPPADGILSKTIYQDDQIKAVVFGFGAASSGLEIPTSRSTLPNARTSGFIPITSYGEATLSLSIYDFLQKISTE